MMMHLLNLSLALFPPPMVALESGDTVTIVGGTSAERMQHFPWFEAGLRAAYPETNLHVRNFGWSADELGLQPRPYKFAGMDAHLDRVSTDVLIAWFGMSESFAGGDGLIAFEQNLNTWLDHHASMRIDGKPMHIVLVSPIAHQPMGGRLPDGVARNVNLSRYTDAMRRVALRRGIPFIDLYRPTRLASCELTINGIHLSDEGHKLAAREMLVRLGIDPTGIEQATPEMLDAIRDKNRLVFERYRPINTEYVYGRRHTPFGDDNFPLEMRRLETLAMDADTRLNQGDWSLPESDTWEGSAPEISVSEGALSPEDRPVPTPSEQLNAFTLPEGWSVNCFASELEFPELANPIAMNWDSAGRLWVVVSPTYPHVEPGARPNDKLIVLEDTDRDGRADALTVFADGLYVPTGFATNGDEAWVVSQPNLLHVMDTNGDGMADRREIVLHGFGSEDSHHSMSAFARPPDGSMYFQEGLFHHTQIESPYGTARLKDAGVMRYDPDTGEVEVVSSWPFANPWGHVFDSWGRSIITDGTNGLARRLTHIAGPHPYPDLDKGHGDVRGVISMTPSGRRPAGGTELLGGPHIPEEHHGWLVQPQNIGFHGVRWYELSKQDSGFAAEAQVQDLLSSSDPTCRPVDLEVGPDGAIYVLDWANPIVGHMQFSVRDPRRDHAHGRIWRITHEASPLASWKPMDQESVDLLLHRLEEGHPWSVRRARLELHRRDAAEVLPAAVAWAESTASERMLLEALWLHQAMGAVNEGLLDRLLVAEDPRARAAAVAVLRAWRHDIEVLNRLQTAVLDVDPGVRLEAVLALGYLNDPRAVELVGLLMRQPIDNGTKAVLHRTLQALKPLGTPGGPGTESWRLEQLDDHALLQTPLDYFSAAERLSRLTVTLEDREKAVEWLAARSGRTVAMELWHASQASRGAAAAELLVSLSPESLVAVVPEAEVLIAQGGGGEVARQLAWAVLIQSQPWDQVWEQALIEPGDTGLIDFIGALQRWPQVGQMPEMSRALRELIGPPPESPMERATAHRIRVELDGPATLTLVEVEVFSDGINVALGQACAQSTLAHGGTADRAVDGLTNGDWMAGHSTHTLENQPDPWWEVDLGAEYPIDHIVIHNRTNRPHHLRLDDFRIIGLNETGQQNWSVDELSAPTFQMKLKPGAGSQWLAKLAAFEALALLEPDLKTLQFLSAWYDMLPDDASRMRLAQAMSTIPEDVWPDELKHQRVKRIRIATVPAKMIYDLRKFDVTAGQPVELELVNEDNMPHNLIVGRPGSLRRIGRAADAQGIGPDAMKHAYVPEVEGVLHASPLVAEGATEYLRFIAPQRPGRYPYICTYPGHWQMMNGVMNVRRR